MAHKDLREVEGTACKMNEVDWEAMIRWANHLGETLAYGVHTKGGSLGSAREGMIAALTHGFDLQAATILKGDA